MTRFFLYNDTYGWREVTEINYYIILEAMTYKPTAMEGIAICRIYA